MKFARATRITATRVVCVLAVLASFAATSAGAEARPWWAGRLRAGTGFEFSRGKFGEGENTDTWFVPFSLKYVFEEIGLTDEDEIEFRVGLPYQRIKGPNARDEPVSSDDVGDPSITVGYSYVPESSAWPVSRFRTRVKLPTAFEDEDLGSDRTDFTFEGDLFHTFQPTPDRYPRIFTFGGVGYRVAQDSHGTVRKDGPRASVGGGLRFNETFAASVDYSWHTTTTPGGTDAHEIVSGFSVRLPFHLKAAPYVATGLSKSVADWGVGLSLSVTIDVE